MKDKIDSSASFLHRVKIEYVSFAKVDPIDYAFQILVISARKVIHSADLLAPRHKGPRYR